jgi:hypothetical protein
VETPSAGAIRANTISEIMVPDRMHALSISVDGGLLFEIQRPDSRQYEIGYFCRDVWET